MKLPYLLCIAYVYLFDYVVCQTVSIAKIGNLDNLCDNTIPDQNHLISPRYPDRYPKGVRCVYEIRSPVNTRLEFELNEFELEIEFNEKCHDHFVLQETFRATTYQTKVELQCGTLPSGRKILASTNFVRAEFETDTSVEATGYNITIRAIDITQPLSTPTDDWIANNRPLSTADLIRSLQRSPCVDQLISVPVGQLVTFSSPGYPGLYPEYAICNYHFDSPPGTHIEFNAVDFHLEAPSRTDGCKYDTLTFQETVDGKTIVLGGKKFCGLEGPKLLSSTSNSVRAVFQSDLSNRETGFSITAISRCGSTIALSPNTSMIFSSDTHTELFSESAGRCVYNFVAPVDYNIEFTTSKYSPSTASFDNHNAKFRLGETINGIEVPLGTINLDSYAPFSGPIEPTTLRSRTNRVRGIFSTEPAGAAAQFNISIKVVSRYLVSLATNATTTFTSPGYPQLYPRSTNRTYDISAPKGYVIELTAMHFEMEPGSDTQCPYDWLGFFERIQKRIVPLGPKYCGNKGPQSLVSQTNHLKAVFVSDFSSQFTGFNITAKAVRPSANFSQSTSASVLKSFATSTIFKSSSHYILILLYVMVAWVGFHRGHLC
ncbi:hypothetical protein RvY_03858 [Ramazzottius varieornatus]|uniref:CUB domain-containing protein n=1 Tax=Ramazzottius varieornatus TaxID=947166 RepID=A0A1D1UWK5_RAMVA|nr:hypothetical protein RvY_03858 [Ramazzottius varieornatus]